MAQNLDIDWVAEFNSGTLLSGMLSSISPGQHQLDAGTRSELVALHNNGEIDLVVAYCALKGGGTSGHFFRLMELLGGFLPELEDPVERVAALVVGMTLEAGDDLLSHRLIPAFRSYCLRDESRPELLLDQQLEISEGEFSLLTVALICGACFDEKAYVAKAVGLLEHESENTICRSIYALGEISYNKPSNITAAVNSILAVAREKQSDQVLSSCLEALHKLSQKTPRVKTTLSKFLNEFGTEIGPCFVNTATSILYFDRDELQAKARSQLFAICGNIDLQNTSSVRNLDLALAKQIDSKDYRVAIDLMEDIARNNKYGSDLSAFSNTKMHIFNNRVVLSFIVTRWLLSRNAYLGKHCTKLMKGTDEGIDLSFDKKQLSVLSQEDLVFLARKACGRFFHFPKTALSLIASLINYAKGKHLGEIISIVFDPLYVSYPSCSDNINEFFGANRKHKKAVNSLIRRINDYKFACENVCKINEHLPSEEQRYTYARYEERLFSFDMEDAFQGSILGLFSNSPDYLLYGSKSISYTEHAQGVSRQVMPLHSHQHSMRWPMLFAACPNIIEYKIRGYCVEGCES